MNKLKKIILKFIPELEDIFEVISSSFMSIFMLICLCLVSINAYDRYLDFNYVKQNIMKYYQKNNTYPTDINQLDKENLVNINGNMYIYNKDTDHLIYYTPIINEDGKIIKFIIKTYDINCDFITSENYESEDFDL